IAIPLPERVEPAVVLASPVQEAHLAGHHLGGLAPVAVAVLVGANLESANHADEPTLLQVLSHRLSEPAPHDDVDEVGLALALLVGKRAVHREGEAAYGDPAGRVAQVGVADE